MKNRFYRIRFKQTLAMLMLTMSLSASFGEAIMIQNGMVVYASEEKTQQQIDLEDTINDSAVLISKIFEAQYKEKREELQNIIIDNEDDMDLTNATFDAIENPLKETDYARLISLYLAAKNYCKENNLPAPTGLAGVEYLSMEIVQKEITMEVPKIVTNYELVKGGYYVKSGNIVIEEETELPVYEEYEDGKYRKTDKTEVYTPVTETIPYGEVKLSVASEDDIATQLGVSLSDIEGSMTDRIVKIDNIINPVTLTQSTFVNTRKDFTEVSEITLNDLAKLIRQMTPDQKKVVNAAVSLVGGVPYEWGGKATKAGVDESWWTFDENGKQKGLDCSGFVQWAFMTAGYDKDVTDSMYSTGNISNLAVVEEEDLKPGDLGLLFDGYSNEEADVYNHVGIYLGDGYFVHCSSGKDTVVISKFGFKTYRRVIETNGINDENSVNSGVDYVGDDSYTDNGNYADSVNEAEEDTGDTLEELLEVPTSEEKEQDSASSDTPKEEIEEPKEENTNKEEQEKTEEQEEVKPEEKTLDDKTEETVEEPQTPSEPETVEEDAAKSEEEPEVDNAAVTMTETIEESLTAQDKANINILAKLVTNEAKNQGYNGWVAVAEVVKNRVESDLFPNTYNDVIYQKGQFSGTSRLSSLTPSDEIISAVTDVYLGTTKILNNPDVLYFRNPKRTSGIPASKKVDWGSHKWFTFVNDHAFYVQ